MLPPMFELSARTRSDNLRLLAEREFDIVVVGGGVTGAGVALDAATRGLRVGLVEAHDFAYGTSSRSSKMIHGGLRYLATGDAALVREALRERARLQRNARHMVRPLPMLIPLWGRRAQLTRAKLAAGLMAYDLLGAWRAGAHHSWADVREIVRSVPNVDSDNLIGGFRYQDAQADDARLVVALVRTAAAHGAIVVNAAPVTRLVENAGRVTGVELGPAGVQPFEVRCGVVVNATGVYAAQMLEHSGLSPGFALRPSKGIHLTVSRERVGTVDGVSLYGRYAKNVFVEPWAEDLAVIGTTDDPYTGDLAEPAAGDDEIEKLLHTVNAALRRPLVRADVISHWAGLRPLIQSSEAETSDLSRAHQVRQEPGLVTIVGGKLTTYRAMAEDAVDAAGKALGMQIARSSTASLQLEGADVATSVDAVTALGTRHGIDRALARHLLRRYGSRAEHVLSMRRDDPSLGERLHPHRPDIAAEAAYAARYEMALTADDVLARRTRLVIETSDRGAQARGAIEQIIARGSEAA